MSAAIRNSKAVRSFACLRFFAAFCGLLFSLSAVAGPGDDTISIQLKDERVCDLIREVAGVFEVKVVVPEELCQQRVSLKFRDVTWQQIFTQALKGTGYTFLAGQASARIVKIVKLTAPYSEKHIVGRWVLKDLHKDSPCVSTSTYLEDGTYSEELVFVGSGKGMVEDMVVRVDGTWKLEDAVFITESQTSSRPKFIQPGRVVKHAIVELTNASMRFTVNPWSTLFEARRSE